MAQRAAHATHACKGGWTRNPDQNRLNGTLLKEKLEDFPGEFQLVQERRGRVNSATGGSSQAAITRIERDAIIQNYSATRITVLRKRCQPLGGQQGRGNDHRRPPFDVPTIQAFILVSEHHRFPIDLFEVTDGTNPSTSCPINRS